MSRVIVYGLGGECSPCDPTHDHPPHNIVEDYLVDDGIPPTPTAPDVGSD